MNCDKCVNAGICKYEENSRKIEAAMLQWADEQQEVERPEVLTFYLKCDKFHLKYPAIKTPFVPKNAAE